MIAILSMLGTAFGALKISTDLRSHYLYQNNIVVDIQIFNDGDKNYSIPNLEQQTWRVQFEVQGKDGKHSYQSTKNDNNDVWNLAPRQTKKVRYSIPNSASLSKGKHNISITIDLPSPYQEKKEVLIVSKDIQYADIATVSEDAYFQQNSFLWTQPLNKNLCAVYLNSSTDHFLIEAPKEVQPYQSIAKGEERHLYWWASNQLFLHSLSRNTIDKRQHKVSSPWPNTDVLTRGVTDQDRSLHIPIWIPSPQKDNSGTIQIMAVDYKGIPTYRKIINVKQKPVFSDMAITEQHTPLLVVQHAKAIPPYNNAVYLYTLSQVGDAKIDALPPKSSRLYIPSEGEVIKDIQFGVHTEHGLVVYVVSKKESNHYLQIFSHQGNSVEQNILIEIPQKVDISRTQLHGTTPTMLGTIEGKMGLYHEGSWGLLKEKYPDETYISNEANHPYFFFLQNGKVKSKRNQ